MLRVSLRVASNALWYKMLRVSLRSRAECALCAHSTACLFCGGTSPPHTPHAQNSLRLRLARLAFCRHYKKPVIC